MKKIPRNHIAYREVEMLARNVIAISLACLIGLTCGTALAADSADDEMAQIDPSAKYLLQTDRQVSSMNCDKEPLQQTLLSLSRQK